MNGYPPWGFSPPQSGVVYVPQPAPGPAPDPLQQIVQWKHSLEQLEKAFKKEEKKDSKPRGGDANVLNMMFLMILLSPITGPLMSHFFTWGLSYLPR